MKVLFPGDLMARLKTFISERSGLYFKDHDLRELEGAISKRMEFCGMASVPAFISAWLIAMDKIIMLTASSDNENFLNMWVTLYEHVLEIYHSRA